MLHFVQGDILQSDAEALVNPVNCVGVMGKGLALQFKQAFPGNFKVYKRACADGAMKPGRMLAWSTGDDRYIINFPTKRHWKDKSCLEDIEAGLKGLMWTILYLDIRSIAIPPLGCGLGGLRWQDVRPLIETAFDGSNVEVFIYEPT
jgi:O-acetyl-ADP-ribose deacetylase (regulator of RNase III)